MAKSLQSKPVIPGERGALIALAVLCVLAAVLRIVLADYPFWFDDYASVFFARQPFAQLWSGWMVRETNPPLFYAILHGWIALFGASDRVWLRIPGILANLATIVVVYGGIKRSYGVKAAVSGAMMLAVSAQQIFYAQQLRGYSFLSLALAVSFFGLTRIAMVPQESEKSEPLEAWVAYAGGALAGIYLHTTAILWPAIASVSLIMVDRRFWPLLGRRWLWLALADVAILIGAGWWLYITYLQMQIPNANISWIRYDGFKTTLWTFRSTVFLTHGMTDVHQLMPTLVFLLAVFGTIRTRAKATTKLCAACFCLAVGGYILISQKQPIIMERTLLWITLFPLTLAAAGLGTIRSPWRYGAACLGAFLMLLTNLAWEAPLFGKEHWDNAVTTVAQDKQGVLIVDGEGQAVVVEQACLVALHRSPCPFPTITLTGSGQRENSWAHDYAQKAPRTGDDRLLLAPQSRFYFIERKGALVLQEMQEVGLLQSAGSHKDFFLGPYTPPLAAELVRHSRVKNGLVELIAVQEGKR